MRYFISERPSRQVHHIQGLKKENLDTKPRKEIYSGRFPPKKGPNRKTGKNLKEDFMKKEGKRKTIKGIKRMVRDIKNG